MAKTKFDKIGEVVKGYENHGRLVKIDRLIPKGIRLTFEDGYKKDING